MMSVLEYAEDINKKVSEVLKKCTELGIEGATEKYELSEDEIILLDTNMEDAEEETSLDINEDLETEFAYDDKAEKLAESLGADLEEEVKKTKIVNKRDAIQKQKSNFAEERKNMYKNKRKLTTNDDNQEDDVVLYKENMTVKELAEALDAPTGELIGKLMKLGVMATINNSLDFETTELVVTDYDKELKNAGTVDEGNFEEFEINDKVEDLEERPPVITIMGHVDHGKTTLLDYIRKANVAEGEAGGITQHIGAYQVEHEGKKLTFIDTPGHAAFTEMRARGANMTDIVIIIVAADDGVMPQTREAIDHAKAAGVPIVVAINKMDKPGADPDKVMAAVADCGLTPESWGGDTLYVKLSAISGEGIPELLENLLLIAEMQELKSNPNRYASGTVIEARLDKKVGSIVTLLIQNGTLRLGDPIVIGTSFGKVRTLKNDQSVEIVEAAPGMPVEVTGVNKTPTAGDKFMAFESDKKARAIGERRATEARLNANKATAATTLDDLFANIQEGMKEINLIIKADVNGSAEAVKNTLQKVEVEGVKINIIRSTVGTITESDVVLAEASKAIIIGFNVRANAKTNSLAKEAGVDIRNHNIIYKVVEEIESAMKGILDPEFEEKILGEAEVRQLFKFSKVGTIAGCSVTSGVIRSNSKVRVMRDGIVIYDGEIDRIQREKDQAKDVKKGMECGITIQNYDDLKENDVIEAYEMVEVKK